MYIQKAEIKNIRSIENFEIKFPNPAGWHVLIGENGSGKSTIIRSIALGLIGDAQAEGLRENWSNWLNTHLAEHKIRLDFVIDDELDRLYIRESLRQFREDFRYSGFLEVIFQKSANLVSIKNQYFINEDPTALRSYDIYQWDGVFSAAYGPYRRFKGGSSEWEELFKNPSFERLAAHLSVFDESVALTEPINWLKDLNYKSLENKEESQHTLENLRKLINSEDNEGRFLQHNAQLESVSSEGVFFKDGNGTIISVNQMSDGYRSILSMTFELIRQLVRVYGSELVFKQIQNGVMIIDLPGVVLIDEIDAHLHPTWQTRIGQWFLKYFPKLQFIVTTHSPLVCRAAENGSIWRLKAPGSEGESGEITGLNRDRLIHGNILDAYGTEVFGENVSISEDSNDMLNRLAELNVKSMMGEIEEAEHAELENLKAVLPTESNL